MAKFAVTAILITLLSVSPTLYAEDQSADIEELTKQLSASEEDRDHLRGRLRRAIAYSKANSAKLSSAETDRDNLRNRLRRAIAYSKANSADAKSVEADRDNLRNRLRRAIAYSKANSANAGSVEADRDKLRNRLRRAIAYSKANSANLESITADRDNLRNRLRRAIAYSKANRAGLERKLANASGNGAGWASNASSDLDSSIGGIEGIEVTTQPDNSVRVRVGNSGLFRTGSDRLSVNGTALLSQIAGPLAQQGGQIIVVGHTDDVPVGGGSPFALSLIHISEPTRPY